MPRSVKQGDQRCRARAPWGVAPCGVLGAVLWPRSRGIPVGPAPVLSRRRAAAHLVIPGLQHFGFPGPFTVAEPPRSKEGESFRAWGLPWRPQRLEESGGERGAESGRARVRWDRSACVFLPAQASWAGRGSPRGKRGESCTVLALWLGTSGLPLAANPHIFKM